MYRIKKKSAFLISNENTFGSKIDTTNLARLDKVNGRCYKTENATGRILLYLA